MVSIVPRSLTIAILSISIFIFRLSVNFVCAQNWTEGTAASRPLSDPLPSRFLRFGRLTAADGLSNDQIWGIAQDQQGFIWIAANDGLNRYDGSDVKVYRHDPDDPRSLGHSFVRTMTVDQNGTIWAGTWGVV